MSNRESQIENFVSAIRALKLLDDAGLERFRSIAQATQEQSLLELLSQTDQVTPQQVDMVDLLARGDQAIPGYRIHDVIGIGGMGVVWKAKQKSLDRFVALKMITAGLQNSSNAIARFEREAVAIAKLSHPNIVTALDFGKHQNRLYLAMEIVSGQDLGEYIEHNGALAETFAWGIARQVAAGLAHASREGVIHRDIKPANVLVLSDSYSEISPTGVPAIKITDFGLALLNVSEQPVDARLTSTGAAIGSPHYMAPEQFSGNFVDTRTDIYALGATVFQMLTGEPPWHGKNLTQLMADKLSGKQAPFDEVIFKVNPKTLRLVQRMMASEMGSRPDNCSRLLIEIDEVLAEIGKPVSAAAVKTHNKPISPSKDFGLLNEGDTAEFQVFDLNKPDLASDIARGSSTTVPTRELSAAADPPLSTAKAVPRRFKFARFAGLLSLVIGLLVVVTYFPFSGIWQPISLELEQNTETDPSQFFLFEGESPFRPPYRTHSGSWIEQQGWLVADPSSSRNWINYQLPEWTYYEVEMIVRTDESNLIDVAFGGSEAGKTNPQFSVRFQNGQAQLGRLAKIYGDFTPIGEPVDLIAGRNEHYLEIQKNKGGWTVQLYRNEDLRRSIAFLDGLDPADELTLICQKTVSVSATADAGLDSAFSELSVVRMKPAN